MRDARIGQTMIILAVTGAALATAQTLPLGQPSTATVIENIFETRFQLDLNVPDAVLSTTTVTMPSQLKLTKGAAHTCPGHSKGSR